MSSKELLSWERNVCLAPFSTYKIGGPAKLFLKIETTHQMKAAIGYCQHHQLPYYILGKGSNTLFHDRGFNGAVLLNKIEFYKNKEGLIHAGSGLSFPWLGIQTAKLGFGGLEYAAGVPGSLGGAIYMNAGAGGQEIKDVLVEVEFLDTKGKTHLFSKDQLLFKYRWSSFHLTQGVILSAKLQLIRSENSRTQQKEHLSHRQLTQPLKENSCGCVFRNLEGVSIGALIDQLGLKGYQIGGAQVSDVHANFIVNKGGASSKDILDLVKYIEKRVREKKGLVMQREIRFIPFEGL